MAINIKIKTPVPVTVENSDATYANSATFAGGTLVLADETIEILDAAGQVIATQDNPLYENVLITLNDLTAVKTGIQYQRILPTGQTTSYSTYDDSWRRANRPYVADPANPLYCQSLVVNIILLII